MSAALANQPPSRRNRRSFHSVIEHAKLMYKVGLEGGLRSETEVHHYAYELVHKRADYKELRAQADYLQSLPHELQQLFVPFLSLEYGGEPGEGLAIMPFYPGSSLHHYLLFGADCDLEKRQVWQAVISSLSQLHRHERGRYRRKTHHWLSSLKGRLVTNLKNEGVRSLATSLIDYIQTKHLPESTVTACIIHGDAQAGNILVSDSRQICFIDPLGGSGQSPGDPFYDYSRLFHWVDFAAQCFEWSRHEETGQNFEDLKQDLLADIQKHLQQTGAKLEDWFWFYLYAAFHTSGKFANFKDAKSIEIMQVKLVGYLKQAMDLSDQLTGRTSHANS